MLKSKNVWMAAGTTFFLLLLEVFVVMHIVEAGSDVCSITKYVYFKEAKSCVVNLKVKV